MDHVDFDEMERWLKREFPRGRERDLHAREFCRLARAGLKLPRLEIAVRELIDVAFFDEDMLGEETVNALTELGQILGEGVEDEPKESEDDHRG